MTAQGSPVISLWRVDTDFKWRPCATVRFLEWSQCNRCSAALTVELENMQENTLWGIALTLLKRWPHCRNLIQRNTDSVTGSGTVHTTLWPTQIISVSCSNFGQKDRGFFLQYSQKTTVNMCIMTLKLPRANVCAVRHTSTENLTKYMIPHYPLSAVNLLPHCPLQCYYWVLQARNLHHHPRELLPAPQPLIVLPGLNSHWLRNVFLPQPVPMKKVHNSSLKQTSVNASSS